MPIVIRSSSLATLRSPSNLLYRLRGLHLDGLRRVLYSLARYVASKLHNPRCGLGYVLRQSVRRGKWGPKTKNLTQECNFIQ